MTMVMRGALWIGVFLAVTLSPLVFAVIGMAGAGRGFWTEFSAALGFVGLSLLGLEFALVARVRSVAAPFGTDALVQFHRQIGLVGLALVLVHVAISADVRLVARFYDPATPWRVRFGLLALVALILLIGTSVWRLRLRLSYDVWHALHAVLAVIVVVAALAHTYLVGFYLNSPWKKPCGW